MRYIQGRDGGGIGAIAVHPSKTHIAVAERGNCPNIYVYSLQDLAITSVLCDGTERSYSDVNFSANGSRLVSVGAFPDFLLTVWDWSASAVILRTKAFGQEVFNARFSPDDDSKLTTSGTGHVRFWRMADTFTGLKLQGDIGKFGRVDLSDIHAFAELPDGKVMTGSEGGMLLMWDGALIKTQIGRPDDQSGPGSGAGTTGAGANEEGSPSSPTDRQEQLQRPAIGAHDGPIHVVTLDRSLGVFVTGGDDGFIKFWDYRSMERADYLPDGVSVPSVTPVGETFLGARARARSLVKLRDEPSVPGEGESAESLVSSRDVAWLVSDGSGVLWRLTTRIDVHTSAVQVLDKEALLQGHAGPITGAAYSPVPGEPFAATVGADGSVRCWDTTTQQLVLSSRFKHEAQENAAAASKKGSAHGLSATSVAWAPLESDSTGRTLAVGFSDGTVRVLYRGGDVWKRLVASKPHTQAVVACAYASSGRVLATASADGTVFFFTLHEKGGVHAMEAASAPAEAQPALRWKYVPSGFMTLQRPGQAATQAVSATTICWSADGLSLSVGCADGSVRVLRVPSASINEWPALQSSLDLASLPAATCPVKLVGYFSLAIELTKDAPPPTKEELEARAKAVAAAKSKKGKGEAAGAGGEEELPPLPTEITVQAQIGAVTALAYSSSSRLLIGVSGEGGHQLYEISVPSARETLIATAGEASEAAGMTGPSLLKPNAVYPLHPLLSGEGLHQPRVSCIRVLGSAVLVGTTGGCLFVRALEQPTAALQLALHDTAALEGAQGAPGLRAVTATVAGESMLVVSGGSDGSVALLSLPLPCLAALASRYTPASAAGLIMYKPVDVRLAAKVGFGSAAATKLDPQTTPAYLPSLPAEPVSVPEPMAPLPEATPTDTWLADPLNAAADITAADAYSLQQDRMNSAADARAAAAEEHKSKVRRMVATLRQAFTALRAKVAFQADIHPSRGLTEQELILDEALDAELRSAGLQRLASVDEEHAYELQRRRVQLSKLLDIALGELAVDKVAVTGLSDPKLCVHTVRTSKLIGSAAAEIEQALSEALALSNVRLGDNTPPSTHAPVLDPRAGIVSGDLRPPPSSIPEGSVLTAEEEQQAALESISFESRKAGRIDRREQLKALKAQRPGPTDEYAPDAAAVAWAQRHMGDFKFKLSKGYAPPEGVKLDAPTKRRQILAIEAHLNRTRGEFNSKIATATQRKRAVLQALLQAEAEISAIDAELSERGSVGCVLQYCPGGVQDVLLELSPPDLADPTSTLSTFSMAAVRTTLTAEEQEGFVSLPALAARHISDAMAEVAVARAGASTGQDQQESRVTTGQALSTFHATLQDINQRHLTGRASSSAAVGSGSGAPVSASTLPTESAAAGTGHHPAHLPPIVAMATADPLAAVLVPGSSGLSASAAIGGLNFASSGGFHHVSYASGYGAAIDVQVAVTDASLTEAALTVARRTAWALLVRKAALRARQVALVEGFDALLRRLRRERLEVVHLTCHTASRAIQLRGELALLSEMAMKDAALDSRLARAKGDKAAIAAAQASLNATLAERRVELDGLAGKERALQTEFDETVGSSHPAYSILMKIYRKKIKRGKGKGEEADTGEIDLDDLGDLGDDDEDEEDLEGCPDNCEKGLYNRVLALRERRLDIQDAVEEVNRGLDEVRKAAERQTQKERQVDRDLTTIQAETAAFAREKQGKLNALDTYAVVKLSQITAGAQGSDIATVAVAGAAPAPVVEEGTPLGRLPSTMDHAVLFNKAAVRRLRARIGELEGENARTAAGLKALKGEERRLARDKSGLEAEIAEVRKASHDMQVLKFGKVIDLELLDRSTGLSADALSKVVAETHVYESQQAVEVAAVKVRLAALNDQLTAATVAHTAVLESIATLTARQAALEAELSGRVDKGLTAVALHATLGTPLATGLASAGGTVSLAAMTPALHRAGVRLDEPAGAQAMAAAMDRKDYEPNSTAAVIAGLTLSGRGGNSSARGPVVKDEAAAARQDEEETAALQELVAKQERELAELRAHVALLKGKGSVSAALEAQGSVSAGTAGGKATRGSMPTTTPVFSVHGGASISSLGSAGSISMHEAGRTSKGAAKGGPGSNMPVSIRPAATMTGTGFGTMALGKNGAVTGAGVGVAFAPPPGLKR